MDFDGVANILKPAAVYCVGWTLTLVGNKLDGTQISVRQFGQDGFKKLSASDKERLLDIFQMNSSSTEISTTPDDEHTLSECVEDAPAPNEFSQERESEALEEALEMDISESPSTEEEIEVLEEMNLREAPPVHTGIGSTQEQDPQSSTPPGPQTPGSLGKHTTIQPPTPHVKSRARPLQYPSSKYTDIDSGPDSSSDEEDIDVDMLSTQMDWMQPASDDEESTPSNNVAMSLPLADEVLSAGLVSETVTLSESLPRNLAASGSRLNQSARGTQIIPYGGGTPYDWQLANAAAGFVEILAGTSRGERLITIPYLQKYGLGFNTYYQLLICIACCEGIPLSYAHRHFKDTKTRERMTKDPQGKWVSTQIDRGAIHPLQDVPTTSVFKKKILESVHAAGFTIRDEGLNARFAKENPSFSDIPLPEIPSQNDLSVRPQILGLRVFDNSFSCDLCDKITTTKDGMKSHISIEHPGTVAEENMTTVHAQTLSEQGSWRKFIEVSNIPTEVLYGTQASTQNDNLDLDKTATLTLLRQQKAIALADIDVVRNADIRTIPPVFIRTGVDQFLSMFNRRSLVTTFSPDRANHDYQRLRKALIPIFVDEVNLMMTAPGHHAINRMMTNCTLAQARPRRPFTALTTRAAIASYALLQVKFVWALVMAYRIKVDRPQGEKKNLVNFFKFDDEQTSALRLLSLALDEEQDLKEQSLTDLLEKFYFPKSNTTADAIFNTPLVAFIAYLCAQKDGSYTNIHHIPPSISKIQYMVRLMALRIFNQWKSELGQDGNQDDWLKRCEEFCVRYLQDNNLSPFSSVRYLLHFISVASRNTPRPDFVWWRENTVTIGEQSVDVSQFFSSISQKIKETEEFIEKNILLGTFTLAEIEEKFKLSCLKDPSGDEDCVGNGVLFDAREATLDNNESAELFHEMFRKKCLGIVRDSDGHLRYDHKACMVWMSDIHAALSVVQPLCHITQGPGPGRMSEECVHSSTNTVNLPRNFAFDAKEGTGGFRSGYNKTSFVSDDQKTIFRLLPYSVFRLLYVLIRLIRPIEFAVLLKFMATTKEEREKFYNTYRERIWASWGRPWTAIDLSRNLQRFMFQGTGAKMGARSYRHLAISLQRHFPATNYNRYNTERDLLDRSLALAADMMAGHSVGVADMNYARQTDITTSTITKVHFIRVSKDWHELLGLSTKLSAKQ